jgi:hypothetical protein
VLGGAIAAATWVGGDRGLAIRLDGDERQRAIDRDATAITGIVLVFVALAGTIVQTTRGNNPGPWTTMCAIAGVTYVVALVVLRRRR